MEQRRGALLAALARLHEESVTERQDRPGAALRQRLPRQRGLVSLVGAGPGDPELLTRKAARRLAEADLVLYDALVPPAVVSLAVRAQQIMVGRRKGSETMGQDAIIRTLIRTARRGKRVVRLKGGDPFVFGRGGEEALALAAAGVEFEIVPGVSSALAAADAASIPVTHRGVSATVVVTTGHDLDRFSITVASVDPSQTTLIVMMGSAQRADIAAALVAAGWPASTPAAIVRDATTPEQTIWTGTVSTLGQAAEGSGPATIVIGHVVAIGSRLRLGQALASANGSVPATAGARTRAGTVAGSIPSACVN
jgi:uroporphyrin-III C-methyltransferase/precorrin-2 dehydrogenase/sirohydrochlorin ferrochelatase